MKKVIGITGGIACGKSTITKYLKENGYFVLDADDIARKLSKRGNLIYNEILKSFGSTYLKEDLEINREKLGKLIFYDSSARKRLNEITHPIIVKEIQRKIDNSQEKLIFLELPLLFEAKLSYLCDTIICVYVDKEIQISRLMHRDNISYEYAIQKVESQMPVEEKKKLSDYCILSENLETTYVQLEKIINNIKGEE